MLRTFANRLAGLVALAALLAACAGTSEGSPTLHALGEASSPPASASAALPSATPTQVATESPVASAPPPSPSPTPAPFTLTSTAFAANGAIPNEFTCKGADRSPDRAWTGVPAGTKALVLFVDDPDGRDWVHWSALDIDPSTTGLPAGVKPGAKPPQQGTNDFGKV